MMNRLNILYEDNDILVCQKEAGMPVQTASFRTTDQTDLVRRHLAEQKEQGGTALYLGIVHRLDQPVRGLVVFALNEKAAADLSAQAAGKSTGSSMKKDYLALVRKTDIDLPDPLVNALFLEHQEVLLEDHLIRDPKTNRSRVAKKGEKGAKYAALRCKVTEDPQSEIFQAAGFIFAEEMAVLKEQKEQYAILWIRLLTGRHHQIRVQLSHAGIPIIGDRKYGKEVIPADVSEKIAYPALCAWRLELKHPRTFEKAVFTVGQSLNAT